MSDRHNNPEILAEKYEIKRQLASKGGRKTLLASNIDTEELVVIKLLTFGNDISWDDLKLFEREAETLKSISHPAIPRYVDYFELDEENNQGFALVQTYIDAPSLEEQLQAGRSFSESEIKQLAQVILDILDYLHSRQPAIIHRDIKPSNILLGDRSGNSVGDIYLVDFGSVQNLATKKGSTITIVGTYGYMPPEQFGGRAKPASDLYSLGASLIYLVTGQHPADLFENNSRIEFKDIVNISPGLTNWLDRVTKPNISERFTSAKEALQQLDNCHLHNNLIPTQTKAKTEHINQPPDSKIVIKKSSEYIEIDIPSAGLFSDITYRNLGFLAICVVLIPLFLNFFIAIQYYQIALEDIIWLSHLLWLLILIVKILWLSMVISLPIIFIIRFFLGIFGVMKLSINRQKISLVYKLFGIKLNIPKASTRTSIFCLEKYYNQFIDRYYLKICTARQKYEISNNPHFPVTSLEIDWLAIELGEWLNLPVIEKDNGIAVDWDDPDFYFKKGLSNIQQYNYQNAIHDFDTTIELEPKFVGAYTSRGLAYFHLQEYQKAIKDFSHAIELNPKFFQAYVNRGLANLKLLNYQAAIEDCNRAIKLNPKNIYSYQIRGRIYCYINYGQKALNDFRKQVKLANDSHSYYNLATLQYFLEMYSDAMESFSSCLQLNSQFKFAYYNRANLNYDLGNQEAAVQDFNQAIALEDQTNDKIREEDEHGYYASGLAKWRFSQDIETAIQDLEKAAKIAEKHQYKAFYEKITATIEEIQK